MPLTKHTSIRSALERRAQGYRRGVHNKIDPDKTLSQEAMEVGETDTVLLAVSADADLDSLGSTEGLHELSFGEIKGLAKELLTVHDSSPGPKGDGVMRILMENPNGFVLVGRNSNLP